MRSLIVAIVFLSQTGTVVYAETAWKGPGWYHVADEFFWAYVVNGPFSYETDCKNTLPADVEDEVYYGCEYLSERPEWDEWDAQDD